MADLILLQELLWLRRQYLQRCIDQLFQEYGRSYDCSTSGSDTPPGGLNR